MPNKKLFLSSLLGFFLLSSAGCAPEKPAQTFTESQKYLLKILNEESRYQAVVRTTGKTLWIYIPLKEAIMEIKGIKKDFMAPQTLSAAPSFSVLFIDGVPRGRLFTFEYHIVKAQKSALSKGLATAYSETFNKVYQNTTGAVFRALFDQSERIDFITLVIADIKNGTEIINTLSLADLKKYNTGAMPPDEYNLRILSDSRGDSSISNDIQGGHLAFEEMTWPKFLTAQIIQRIKFKFERSDFKPGEDIEDEVLKIAAQTLEAYNFEDFDSLRLENLQDKKVYLFSNAQLDTFLDKQK